MVSGINSIQAARHHEPFAFATAVAAISRHRRSGAEDAQGGGDCKRDESFLSTHSDLLPFCRRGCAQLNSAFNVPLFTGSCTCARVVTQVRSAGICTGTRLGIALLPAACLNSVANSGDRDRQDE